MKEILRHFQKTPGPDTFMVNSTTVKGNLKKKKNLHNLFQAEEQETHFNSCGVQYYPDMKQNKALKKKTRDQIQYLFKIKTHKTKWNFLKLIQVMYKKPQLSSYLMVKD